MRRVVVTGLGMVTPLGNNVKDTWERLLKGESGIRKITGFDVSAMSCQIAGTTQGFDPDKYMSAKEQRQIDKFILYGVAAAQEAIEDSGVLESIEPENIGVTLGSGIGGLPEIYNTSVTLHEKGPRRVSPFFIPASLINLASGHVSIRHNLRGPNHAVVTACASGAHAIGDAMRMIQMGDADAMVAGGCEAAVCPIGIAGFAAARALSTKFNDTPEIASRPWDKRRDGFVMGEGAGVLVLEELEHAKNRGAKIYAEIVGYGLSGDANHITAPCADGNGGLRAMRSALRQAKLNPEDVNYINAHSTSTQPGDLSEARAIAALFADIPVMVSSTKSSIGHLLGATGSVEAIFSILAIYEGKVPATINLDDPDEEIKLDLVPNVTRDSKVKVALSNSFGFGGTNASLLMREYT